MQNVHILWRDKVTSHGIAESSDATVAPIPSNTSTEGNAQHSNVLNELNREK